jgi:hypothetical protein
VPYTDHAKNDMLTAGHVGTAVSNPITHLGLLQATSKALATPFGVASTDIFTSTAHGMSAGDLVVFTALGGGGAGIILGHPYFVSATNLAANTFSVSGLPAGTPLLDFTTDVVTSGTFLKLTEVTGGAPAYARKTVTWGTAALGAISDSANGTPFDVPGGTTVAYLAFAAHVSTAFSSANILRGIQDVTDEVFAAQGQYTVTDANGLAPD